MRVDLPHQPRLELRQRDARRRDEEVLERRRRLDDLRELATRIRDRVVSAATDRAELQERDAAVRLRIEIDEQRLPTAHRQGRSKVDGSRGLTDAPLLVGDGNDHRRVRSGERPGELGPNSFASKTLEGWSAM
jgi:hypothetical protein